MNSTFRWAARWRRRRLPRCRLARDVRIAPGVIEHLAPYARRVYRGRNMSFRRDRHPLASAAWDRAAEPAQKPKLIRELQAFVDGGGLALGG